MISGFPRDEDENCCLMGCHAASSGSLPTFRDNLSVHLQRSRIQRGFPFPRVKNTQKFFVLKDGTNRFSRNVGKELLLLAAQQLIRAQFSNCVYNILLFCWTIKWWKAIQILTLRLIMSYIYIYDISSLRVNDLTLILLTWRKWTPNNASKWQMGFNSAFKGLNTHFSI